MYQTTCEDSLFLQYLRDSNIHGVKYLGQRKRSFTERIIWILILLASIAASAYFIYGIIGKYNSNPVIVSFQPSQTSVMDVPFASVTVCNANRFKKSALMEFFRDAESDDKEIADLARLTLRQLDHICSLSNTFSTFFNYSINETTVNACERLGIGCGINNSYLASHKFPDAVLLQLLSAFPSCERMIPLCLWEGQHLNCVDHFHQIITDMGFCCSFNAMPRKFLLKNSTKTSVDPDFSAEKEEFWMKFNMDDILLSDHRSNEKYRDHLFFQSKAGQGAGLSFLVNTDMDEYFCDNHDGYGFRVHTHSAIDIPHVGEFSVAVGPNSEMFISLQADLTKAEKDIRDLHVDRRNCYYQDEQTLDSFNFYTVSNCLDQCFAEEIAKKCNCVRLDMGLRFTKLPTLENVTYCEGKAFQCANTVMKNVGKIGTDKVCPTCKPSCNIIEYNAQLSSLPLRKDFTINVLQTEEEEGNGPDDLVRKNASIVHVFFGSDNVYSRIRKNLYSYNNMFAHVGGILGLFLGFSVMSVVEPFNILFRKCFGSAEQRQQDKIQREKSKTDKADNQHYYAKSPPYQNTTTQERDRWRNKCSTFGTIVPGSRIYPLGYKY